MSSTTKADLQRVPFIAIRDDTTGKIKRVVVPSALQVGIEGIPSELVLFSNIELDRTITPGGTVGAQTINKAAGTVNFSSGSSSLVVTNSLVTNDSILAVHVRTNDAFMKGVHYVASSGSFTLYADPVAPGAEVSVGFIVTN